MQKFKGDDLENSFIASGEVIFDQMSMSKDDFFDDCYFAGPLGDLLHDIKRSPLANAIRPDVFRNFFNTIYEEFRHSGSFESYLVVFAKIFGDTVQVTFNADNLTTPDSPPGPGKLQINIIADELEEFNFVARHIDNNMYLYEDVIWYDDVDDPGGNIIFQTVKGFHSQYELEQMLFEMVPDGVFTEITLTFS